MRSILALCFVLVASPALAGDFIVKPSKYSVAETLDRLTKALKSKGITIMARVDHAGGAEKAGLKLKPTQLLILGNPKLGTPLMQTNRGIGLDMPMTKAKLGSLTPSPMFSRRATTSKARMAYSPR